MSGRVLFVVSAFALLAAVAFFVTLALPDESTVNGPVFSVIVTKYPENARMRTNIYFCLAVVFGLCLVAGTVLPWGPKSPKTDKPSTPVEVTQMHLQWTAVAIVVLVVVGIAASLDQNEKRIRAAIAESGGLILEGPIGRVIDFRGGPLSRDLLRDLRTFRMNKLCCPGRLSDTGVEILKDCADLRHLDISGCPGVTDVSVKYLKGMKGLTCLEVDRTNITPEGLEELRKELPKCVVIPYPKVTPSQH